LKAFQKIREDLISRIWVKIRENLSPRKFVHLKELKKQPNDENISITVKPSRSIQTLCYKLLIQNKN